MISGGQRVRTKRLMSGTKGLKIKKVEKTPSDKNRKSEGK
jgi:hypothetical protein